MTSHTNQDLPARTSSHTSQALQRFDTMPADAYVRVGVVAALYSLSRTSVWRWVKAGQIPSPYKIGPQTTAWRVGELRAALATLGEKTSTVGPLHPHVGGLK